VADVAEFTTTAVTLAPILLARGKLAKSLMAASNVLPFCRSLAFSETGVLELKNFSQFAVICAMAAELPPVLGLFGAVELGAEDEAGAEVAGVLEAVVEADVLELLLQAPTIRARTAASVGARVIRRAKGLNRMTRLLCLGRMHC
jgi:hypothetical protein